MGSNMPLSADGDAGTFSAQQPRSGAHRRHDADNAASSYRPASSTNHNNTASVGSHVRQMRMSARPHGQGSRLDDDVQSRGGRSAVISPTDSKKVTR